MGAYAIETKANGRDFNIGTMFVAGFKQAGKGFIDYMTGSIMSVTGFWKLGSKMPKMQKPARLLNYKPTISSIFSDFSDYAMRYLQWAICTQQGSIFRAITKNMITFWPKKIFE